MSEPTLFSNATIVDGTGAPRYRADVLISEGIIKRIASAGALAASAEIRQVDAESLVLSPGFIDMHAHSDLYLLTAPEHLPKITQGVTTEVLGQDGISYAPVNDEILPQIREKIAGWNGNPQDFDFSWRSVAQYLDRLDAEDAQGQRIATNAAYLIPQGTVRALVMGFGDQRADGAQITAMRQVIAEGMEQGAVGLSSGLTYTPGMYASTAELGELCAEVAAHGGFYAPHHRSYGKGALDAYAEMIELSRSSGCALHLAHATMNFAENKGKAPALLELIDQALSEGADISLDTYPYLPGSTTLSAVLPSWSSAGSVDDTLARLADPQDRARIRQALEVTGSDGCHGVVAEWETLEISSVQNPALADYVGRTIQDIAATERREPFEVFCTILTEDRLGAGILQHVGHEENVRAIMTHRVHTGGSDGLLHGAKPHPRAWGTFPQYLGRYSRELGVMSLEETVHHLTGRPAQRLKLVKRGEIREGYAADLVLFDPQTVAAGSTFDNPKQPAIGIQAVYVNGVAALRDGRPTGARAGRALRRTTEGTQAL
ncbi:N-acyl-D-amino-acid deacylase [Arthrobacter sp. MYb211]|uniref:N-acyl-D-amino-acid deacylase family protein n=1 Tax=unclassified Arthrobacter TaxID=235627 RepID=UPI000CFD4B4E|nr:MULTISPECIES: D-aminoacylase [unclassified Arthrobacter]PQZ98670.1 N-acyl-D-amino-acid deacylase [Arthrobacter sp. MYb224]PRA11033.1 N-acyl-D-amino-acid deacylase [Arthrobacter sp. MYb221]PRC07188.1 N-acyl-D-amino-acid deacylase [Arthrobacter sp. MYb211]